MKYYVVRIAPFHDFYVPYQTPMSVWDVKYEMSKQLDCRTDKMILIYKGKLMQNTDMVSNYGAKTGSILFLVVSGLNKNKILAPKRALLEIITLATNLETMEYSIFREAIKTIRSEMDSPKIMALSMVYPTIKPTIEKVQDRLNNVYQPLDFPTIRLLSKTQDDAFNQLEAFSDGLRILSSELSDINTLIEINSEYDECQHTELESDDDSYTNLDYTPSIQNAPLPYQFSYDFDD